MSQDLRRPKLSDLRVWELTVDRFIYTNELEFADDDDVRLIMDQVQIDIGETKKLLSGATSYLGTPEWDYRRLPRNGELEGSSFELGQADDTDARTSQSASSGTSASRRVSTSLTSQPGLEAAAVDSAHAGSKSPAPLSGGKMLPASRQPSRNLADPSSSATPTRTRASAGASGPFRDHGNLVSRPPSSIAGKPLPHSSTQTSPPNPGRSHYPSPRQHAEADPHHHPTSPPPPASALSMYMLSHRYRLETLESLAKEHILTRLTSDNCFPMLSVPSVPTCEWKL